MNIQLIEANVTYTIRQTILRPHQSIDECMYEADLDACTFHVGAFAEGKLVSIASFYNESHPMIEGDLQYRLRGMATVEEFRNQQAGRGLIEFAEKELTQRGADLWWCNARTTVSGYYEKLGLRAVGEVFVIEPIGPHKLMYKSLK